MNWDEFIEVDNGGYMRPDDFCNSTKKGNGFFYTGAVCLEEPDIVEYGVRVINEMLSLAIDFWGALMDAIYHEDTRKQLA